MPLNRPAIARKRPKDRWKISLDFRSVARYTSAVSGAVADYLPDSYRKTRLMRER